MRCLASLALFIAFGPAGQVAAEEPDLDALLQLYRELELPLPPANAILVCYSPGGDSPGPDGIPPAGCMLAWKEGTVSDESPLRLLQGTEWREFDRWRPSLWTADADLIGVLVRHGHRLGMGDLLPPLATCLQLRSRSDAITERALWSAIQAELDRWPDRGGKKWNPEWRSRLAAHAFEYWMEAICKPGGDRTRALKALNNCPALQDEFAERRMRRLCRALELTLASGNRPAGSAERLIDDLTEACSERFIGGPDSGLGQPPEVKVLARQGFEVVPLLLEHLDDQRLTRILEPGVMKAPTEVLRVGVLVREILDSYAGKRQPSPDAEAGPGYRRWWEEVRMVEEGPHLESVAVDGITRTFPNAIVCEALAARYPDGLRTVYRRVIAKGPGAESSVVAQLIADSDLPLAERVFELKRAALVEMENHRHAARLVLARIAPLECAPLVIADFDAVTGEAPTEDAQWRGTHASILALILDQNDVWEAFAAAARRANPSFRLRLLLPTNIGYGDEAHLLHFLKFIRPFLNEAEDGTDRAIAGWISRLVACGFPPVEDAADSEWAEYLARVREAIDRKSRNR